MTKPNSFSRDFFVNASETETRQSILAIPSSVGSIKFSGEHHVSHSLTFLYERENDQLNQFIEVSVLPLSVDETRVSLLVTHADGSAAQPGKYTTNTLNNFERAVQASLNGNLAGLALQEPPVSNTKRVFHFMMMLVASVSVFFLWKKLS